MYVVPEGIDPAVTSDQLAMSSEDSIVQKRLASSVKVTEACLT